MSQKLPGLKPLLIALGNPLRRDDGAGPEVLADIQLRSPERFEFVHHNGDPSDLIDLWAGRDVLIVDAAPFDEDAPPMTVFDPFADPGADSDDSRTRLENSAGRVTSSHALSLAEALELGRLLERLPRSVRVIAVAGEDFAVGDSLSPRARQGIAAASSWIDSAFQGFDRGEGECTKAP